MSEAVDLKLITMAYDSEQGLEVDWEGVSEYEAYGMVVGATEILGRLLIEDDDE